MQDGQATSAPVAPVRTAPQKLTPEEEKDRYEFIGKCVDGNINFPSGTKWGVQGGLTLQDMCNSSIVTLRELGKKVNKELAGHDPEFDGNEPLKIAGLAAEKWSTFIRLTIRKKMYNENLREKRALMKTLKTTIEQAKTPEELRRDAESQLALLRTELGSDAE